MTAAIDCTLTIHRIDIHWDVPAAAASSRALAEAVGERLLARLSALQRRRAREIVGGRVEPGRVDIERVVVHLGAGSPDIDAIVDAIADSLDRRLS